MKKKIVTASLPMMVAATLGVTLWANIADVPAPVADVEQPVQVIVRPVVEDVTVTPKNLPAASAELTVTAPKTVKVGELIEVDASASKGETFQWVITGVHADNYRIVDDGRRALIAAYEVGTISVTIAAALEDTVALYTLQVAVSANESSSETPSAPQEVDPEPEVPLPEIKPGDFPSDLKAAVSKVSTPRKSKQQLALSKAFVAVASLMDSGLIATTAEAIEATKKLTLEAVEPDIEKWKPVIVLIEGYVTKQAEDGKLKTIDDHAKLWREIGRLL